MRRALLVMLIPVIVALLGSVPSSARAGGFYAVWNDAGSMSAAREGATMTAYTSAYHHYVLVTGGLSQTVALASADIYSVDTHTWTPAAPMSHPRVGHTATLLYDGRILVVGGGDATAELYDPASNTWSPAASMSVARTDHTATLLASRKVLVVGGADGPTYLNSAEIYDPVSDSWSPAASMVQARANHVAVRLTPPEIVLVAGGNSPGILASAERYDVATDTWSSAGSMSSPRVGHVAAEVNVGNQYRAIVAGGSDGSAALESADIYDSATNSWSSGAMMLAPHDGGTISQLRDGTLVIAGGVGAGGVASDVTEFYDRYTDTWSAGPALRAPRYQQMAAATTDSDGSMSVLIAGGVVGGIRSAGAEGLSWTYLGPDLTIRGPGLAPVGTDFDVTFATTGVSPNYYNNYQLTVVYDSSLVTVTSITDLSTASGLWYGDLCRPPGLANSQGGVLTPPLVEFDAWCGAVGGANPATGQLAAAHVHVDAPGTILFHMLTWAAPDYVHDTWATWTGNSFGPPYGQVNSLSCAGAVCGTAIGGQAADLVVGTQDTDQDGYGDLQEAVMGTSPNVYCSVMRADVDGDGTVTIVDLSLVTGDFLQAVPPAPQRYDQGPLPFDNAITIVDLSNMAAEFLQPVTVCP
jgi:hypothetical protein